MVAIESCPFKTTQQLHHCFDMRDFRHRLLLFAVQQCCSTSTSPAVTSRESKRLQFVSSSSIWGFFGIRFQAEDGGEQEVQLTPDV
eukprot:6471020-Amphidinium_carterae.1